MKRTSLLAIVILVVVAGSIVGYFVYDSQDSWDGLSCEEMFDFAMSSEHQELTMDQHMKFHKDYDPCNQNP